MELPIVIDLPHFTRLVIVRELNRIVKRVHQVSSAYERFVSLHKRLQEPHSCAVLLTADDFVCFTIVVENINYRGHRIKPPNRALFKAMEALLRTYT